MSSTSTTTTDQTASHTYGTTPGPESADIDAFRKFQLQRDPRIPYAYGKARNAISSSYRNPVGGYTNPQIEQAQKNSQFRGLAQDESQALREENVGFQGMQLGQKAGVAAMTAPRVVETGSKSSGTSKQKQSPGLDSFVQGAAGIGSMLLM